MMICGEGKRKGETKMKTWIVVGVLFLLGSLLAACGDYEPRTPEEQACWDLASAFGEACSRCELADYSQCSDVILQAVGGDCANVVEVRDLDVFYDECLPWFRSIDCDEMASESFELDASCQSQLLI